MPEYGSVAEAQAAGAPIFSEAVQGPPEAVEKGTQSVPDTLSLIQKIEGLDRTGALARFVEAQRAGLIPEESVPGAEEFVQRTVGSSPWWERASAQARVSVTRPVANVFGVGKEGLAQDVEGLQVQPPSLSADIAGSAIGELPYTIPAYGAAGKLLEPVIGAVTGYGLAGKNLAATTNALQRAKVLERVMAPAVAEMSMGVLEGQPVGERMLGGAAFGAGHAIAADIGLPVARALAARVRDFLRNPEVQKGVRAVARATGESTRAVLDNYTVGSLNDKLIEKGHPPVDPERLVSVGQSSGVPQALGNQSTLEAAAQTVRGGESPFFAQEPQAASNATLEAAYETVLGRGALQGPPPIGEQAPPAAPKARAGKKGKKTAKPVAKPVPEPLPVVEAPIPVPDEGGPAFYEEPPLTAPMSPIEKGAARFQERELARVRRGVETPREETAVEARAKKRIAARDTAAAPEPVVQEAPAFYEPPPQTVIEIPTEGPKMEPLVTDYRQKAQDIIDAPGMGPRQKAEALRALAADVRKKGDSVSRKAFQKALDDYRRDLVAKAGKAGEKGAVGPQGPGGGGPRIVKIDGKWTAVDAEGRTYVQLSGRMVAMGAMRDPDTVYEGGIAGAFTDQIEKRHKLAYGAEWLRLPSHASDHPAYLEFYYKTDDAHNKLLINIGRTLIDKTDPILDGIKSQEIGQFVEAMKGLRARLGGGFDQTTPNIPEHLNVAAIRLRKQTDRAWAIASGIDPHAYPILDHLGLKASPKLFRDVRLAQMSRGDPNFPLPSGFDVTKWPPAKRAAIDALQGKLHFRMVADSSPGAGQFGPPVPGTADWKPTHDLSISDKYKEGFAPLLPIEVEQFNLESDLAYLLTDPAVQGDQYYIAKMQDALASKQDRLKELHDLAYGRASASPPLRDVAPTGPSKRSGFISEADRQNALWLYDRNLKNSARRYFNSMMAKRYFDEMYMNYGNAVKAIQSQLVPGNIQMADDAREIVQYMTNLVNAQRGVRGYSEDRWARRALSAVRSARKKMGLGGKGHPMSQEETEQMFSDVMRFQFATKIGLSARFPLVNSTQSLLPWILTSSENYGRSVADVMAGPAATVRRKLGGATDLAVWRPWSEARREGIGVGTSQYFMEAQSNRFQSLVSKLSVPANITEGYNRVLSYWIGKQHILGGMEPHSAVRMFTKLDRESLQSARTAGNQEVVERLARKYGRGLERATQFSLSGIGRPVALTGSGTRRMVSQFKPYMYGWTALAHDSLRSDWRTAMKFSTAMMFLGGLRGMVGGPTADAIRREIIKETGWVPPSGSGVGYMTELLPFSVSSIMDVSNAFDPVNMPRDLGGAVEWALGPTVGSIVGAPFRLAAQYGRGEFGQMAKTVARPVLPLSVSVTEAVQEAATGHVKIRDKVIAEGRPWWQTASRSVNLQPSAITDYYNRREDLRAALEGGQRGAALSIIQDAKRHGIKLGLADIEAIGKQITQDRKHSLSAWWKRQW